MNRCPFCGESLLTVNPGRLILRRIWHYVFCPTCSAQGPSARTAVEAIELWNNRVAEEKEKSDD